MFLINAQLVANPHLTSYTVINEYTIELSFDDEAQKWYAQNDEIPIILEDFSLDTLIKRIKLAVPEMLEINKLV